MPQVTQTTDASAFYHLIAAYLAEGGEYTSPFTLLPTAHFAPGYSFFLAGLYWVFGRPTSPWRRLPTQCLEPQPLA